MAAVAQGDCQPRELAGGVLGELLARLARAQMLRVVHDRPQDTQRLRGCGQQVVEVKAWTRLTVPVKFVWTSKRSRSQTTSRGGFSSASRYWCSWT